MKSYYRYGKRGITVCEEWRSEFETFRDWAFESGYQDGLSLDRIDVNGNYEPSNCRWINAEDQCHNKRQSRMYEFNGKVQDIAQRIEICYPRCTIGQRMGYRNGTHQADRHTVLALNRIRDRQLQRARILIKYHSCYFRFFAFTTRSLFAPIGEIRYREWGFREDNACGC